VVADRDEKTILAPLQEVAAEAERDHIKRILSLTKGNRSQASEILGVSRKTLWEKIRLYRLDV
jgi:DNA-binding NtrC family response regulator